MPMSATPPATSTTSQRSPANVATQRILSDVRARIELRAGLGQPIEAQVNNITDYLRGILVGIRAVDPSVFEALRAEYESALCAVESPTDVEVLVFTKLAVMQPEIASPRALDCALERHETEDIVLWSLLDAWSAGGQIPLSAVAALEQRADDPRTLERLKTPREQRAELDAMRALRSGPAGGEPLSLPGRGREPFLRRANAQ